MSEYFALRCDTCGVELGRPELLDGLTRNGEKELRTLIADAPKLIAAAAALEHRYDLDAWWGTVPIAWLEEHAGHALRPISEYEERPPF